MVECPKLIPADPLQTKGKQSPHKSHKTLCAIFIPEKKRSPGMAAGGPQLGEKETITSLIRDG